MDSQKVGRDWVTKTATDERQVLLLSHYLDILHLKYMIDLLDLHIP